MNVLVSLSTLCFSKKKTHTQLFIFFNFKVPSERKLFLKEENSNFYRVSSYFLGKVLVELPYIIIYPIISITIVFWACGYST